MSGIPGATALLKVTDKAKDQLQTPGVNQAKFLEYFRFDDICLFPGRMYILMKPCQIRLAKIK